MMGALSQVFAYVFMYCGILCCMCVCVFVLFSLPPLSQGEGGGGGFSIDFSGINGEAICINATDLVDAAMGLVCKQIAKHNTTACLWL